MALLSYHRQTTTAQSSAVRERQRIRHGGAADPYMTSAPLSIHIDAQTGTCSSLKIPGSKLHPFISINFPSSTNLFRFPSYILIHCFSCTGAPLVCRSSPMLYSILRCKQNRHFQRESSTGKM